MRINFSFVNACLIAAEKNETKPVFPPTPGGPLAEPRESPYMPSTTSRI